MGKAAWGVGALRALKEFGEKLAKRAETDPRLARAVEQGYDLRSPTLHGAKRVLPGDEGLRPLFAAQEPGLALNFTGGGRRAGPGSPAKGGVTHPLVVRGPTRQTELEASELVPYDTAELAWLEKLGITDPQSFMERVRAANYSEQEAMLKSLSGTDFSIDPHWAMSIQRAAAETAPRPRRFYEMLDNPAFVEALKDSGASVLDFSHPYTARDISGAGRLRVMGEEPGTARLILDAEAVRSPFAEFKTKGKGLMKKTGGLVQMQGKK